MKKLLCIAFAIALFGCKNEIKQDYAIITGKIINKQAGDLTINSEDRTIKEKLEVTEDGTFIDTLNTDIKSYVLFDGVNPVFLKIEPGYNLNITYDATNFDKTISITGVGSEINNYLISKRKVEMELSKKSAEFFVLTEDKYKASVLDFKKSQEELLNSTKELPSDFIAKELRNINYGYLSKLNTYERGHQYFTKNQEFKVSEGFLKEVTEVDVNNIEDFEFSSNYKEIVIDHYSAKARELSEKESIAYDLAFIKTVSAIESETIKNTLLFDFVNFNMSYSNDIDAFFKAFTENSTNEKNNKLVSEKYEKLTSLKEGKPSPKFVNYENHSGGKMSLDDLKGKYVYIDVWATWCGPCIQQIPHLQEVEKKYHDKNIEFVSISIDKKNDYEKWKSMVNEKQLGGIQLFADNDWNSAFVQEYQIQGIPKFILIDTKGNIVDSNAPRPSSEKLIELFDKHNL
ncbi:TlpA disulfide reductase family protein [uncultured Algibacter sp.]|uniref:TlpA family protein disulfide reductase n=1 Tax=uncultured Algibacter sp. TaxID=298659 RepID=UPI00260424F4|nr:TlpA disulfide reductase family protein [uncultured Algibacter sp.]